MARRELKILMVTKNVVTWGCNDMETSVPWFWLVEKLYGALISISFFLVAKIERGREKGEKRERGS